jgi:hypothetical protein
MEPLMLPFNTKSIHCVHAETGRKETRESNADNGIVVGHIRRVRGERDVEEYAYEYRREKNSRRSREQGQKDGKCERDGEQRPAEVSAFGLRPVQESERLWEIGFEADALDVVLVDAREVAPLSDQGQYAAASIAIVDKPGMDRGSADERVAAVVGVLEGFLCVCRTANNQRPIVLFFVSNGVWIEELDALAIRRAAEGYGMVLERSAEVAVKTAAIPGVPCSRLDRFLDIPNAISKLTRACPYILHEQVARSPEHLQQMPSDAEPARTTAASRSRRISTI